MAKQVSYISMDHFSTGSQSNLNSFVDELLHGADDGTKRKLIVKELNDAINERLADLLSKEDSTELKELIDDEAPEDIIQDFFETKIPNFESEVATVLLQYKNNQIKPVRVSA